MIPTDVSANAVQGTVIAARFVALGLATLAALLGNAVPDLDLWLQRQPLVGSHFPHRGPTHAILNVALAGGLILWGLTWLGLAGSGIAFVVGWSFHILLDLLTPQGVAIAWPWRRRFRLLPLARALRTPQERQLCRFAIVVVLLLPLFLTGS